MKIAIKLLHGTISELITASDVCSDVEQWSNYE